MPAPIRDRWWNRPGWGEYHALRGGKPTHGGFDSYTTPLATIFGTANNGIVIGKGYVAGGWGFYIDVKYPAQGSTPAYVQRDCHMNEASPLAIGATVHTTTALGRVGRTGNAADIFWPASQSPNGKELWHVHSETYLSTTVNLNKRTNPITLWGVNQAGGGGNIIPPPLTKGNEMDFRYFSRTNPTTKKTEWAITHPLYFPDGVFITTDPALANGFAPYTGDSQDLTNERWDGMLKTAKLVYDRAWQSERERADLYASSSIDIDYDRLAEALLGVVSGSPTATEVAQAVEEALSDDFSAIPTAQENGQAAREAIVKP